MRSPRHPAFMRASRYYQTGERFIHPRSQRSMDVYAKSVAIFKEAAGIIRHPRIEPVEVPYDGTSLPALLVHPDPAAAGSRPAPCMVFFDGFDVTKELQYGYGIPDLAARGIGCLIVDGPGNGESVRFRNLPAHCRDRALRHAGLRIPRFLVRNSIPGASG